ncbi:Mutanase [Colletotrichum fructicola Nara gc5]|uniref:Mutanase n=1 Tax=Colletotrichum fructicola (strain Nara gc5) TaxID=1213859 RepID=A0A7J6JP84_COLFN|nr:Mutanase [Colletotrichum fructicola Nara gc5]
MRFPILTSLAVLASACHVQAKAVFAHFMVGNTGRYSTATWRDDIRLAQEAHIDGFALNIAYGERMNAVSLENVFEVASDMGFKLIFSFDYAGGGPWPKDDVLNLLKKYATRPEYFKHSDGTPLVSTFEGPEQASDWVDIKRSFPCFFMPDWSSKGAKRAAELAGGVADGLFNWAAWPWGNTNMDTYVDASYYQYLRVDEDTTTLKSFLGTTTENPTTSVLFVLTPWADDNGEAYFEVKGTNHEFRIRCTTHYPSVRPIRFVVDLDGWGLGVKEYEVPETEVSITFVITGSENYGYYHSLTLDSSPVAWMDSIKEHIKGRLVKHVIMPGAHDAGMSVIGKYQWGGTSMDTQTQAYGIAEQLELGARYFDLRPAIADGEFHIFHVTDPRATVILGASGVTLQNVIHDINNFYLSHPGEVVFLWMRDMVSFRGGLFGGGHPFDGDEMAQFFDKLRGIQNRCRGLTEATRLQERVMGELMEQNGGTGCVAIILEQFGVDPRIPQDDPASGIFLAGKHMDRTDRWEENVAGFYDPVRRRLEPSKGGDFFVSQWVLNARHEDAVFWGLENLANYLTTPMLYYGGVAEMTPEMFPTVMLMDYIGVRVSGDTTANNRAAELRTLALGLNLYMVSENCYVSKRRNPLVKKSNKKLAAPWNGIIFANGTRIDNPPPNYDPWRVDVLKSGTVFGNGTVLTRNITNPF